MTTPKETKEQRLARLDAEMMAREGERFQYLSASHDGKRFIICVMKIAAFRYAATTSTQHPTKNIVLRAYGKTPSDAVNDVLGQLKHNLRQSPEMIAKWFPKMQEVAK